MEANLQVPLVSKGANVPSDVQHLFWSQTAAETEALLASLSSAWWTLPPWFLPSLHAGPLIPVDDQRGSPLPSDPNGVLFNLSL